MRNWPRLGIGLALAVLCSLALAACGGGGDSSGGEESSGSGEPAEISGKVTVWDYVYKSIPEYTKAIDQLDSEFEKMHPGVTVERVSQPFESYESLLQAAFTAREGPDTMLTSPGATGVLHFKKGLEVLNDRMPADMQDQLVGWEAVTPGFTVEGDHYGIPIGFGGEVFYYNKAMFAKAGLPREFKPDNWDEVVDAAEKLQAAGIQPFTGGNKEGYENGFWLDWGWPSSNTYEQAIELAEGELEFTDPAFAAALGPEFEMQEKGFFPSDLYSTALFTEGFPRFGEEKGAMAFGFMTQTGYWGEYNETLGEENVGMIFPPGSDILGIEPNYTYSIPTYAENKDAAWALIEFLASAKGSETLLEVAGVLPNRKDVEVPPDMPVQAHELVEAVQTGKSQFNVHDMLPGPVFFGPLLTEVNEALQGRISLEDAQQVLQETFEKSSS